MYRLYTMNINFKINNQTFILILIIIVLLSLLISCHNSTIIEGYDHDNNDSEETDINNKIANLRAKIHNFINTFIIEDIESDIKSSTAELNEKEKLEEIQTLLENIKNLYTEVNNSDEDRTQRGQLILNGLGGDIGRQERVVELLPLLIVLRNKIQNLDRKIKNSDENINSYSDEITLIISNIYQSQYHISNHDFDMYAVEHLVNRFYQITNNKINQIRNNSPSMNNRFDLTGNPDNQITNLDDIRNDIRNNIIGNTPKDSIERQIDQ